MNVCKSWWQIVDELPPKKRSFTYVILVGAIVSLLIQSPLIIQQTLLYLERHRLLSLIIVLGAIVLISSFIAVMFGLLAAAATKSEPSEQ